MTFTNPIVSVQPTSDKKQLRKCSVGITNVEPPAWYRYWDDEQQAVIEISQQPQRVGQMLAYISTSASSAYDQLLTLYVVIDNDGELQWRVVESSNEVIDSRTGKVWDANAGFWNPLAT